ncbi:putative inorganic phosphate cotransporter [Photinus pyralis]|uniref:putative inorganic phosphate cotransporter n=1 Tax=Photinus pyralis TaxID=7054 RepID=UPI00126766D0|nr:putative inorganic phosphate cotransporter [Photinus pyralis]
MASFQDIIKFGGWYFFCAFRFISGFAHGPLLVSASNILAKWVPKGEQPRALLLVLYAGPLIGGIIAHFGAAILITVTSTSRAVYYCWLGYILLYAVSLVSISYPNPESHLRVTPEERQLLNQIGPVPLFRTVLKKGLCDMQTLGIICGWIGHSITNLFVNVNLPLYLRKVLKFNILEIGIIFAAFYVCTGVGILMATKAQRSLTRWISVVNVRRLFIIIGNLGPLICLLSVYAGCARILAACLFTLNGLLIGPALVALRASISDLTEDYESIVTAWVIGVGSSSYVIAPNFIAELANTNALLDWPHVFLVFIIVVACLTACSVLKCSQERADWTQT